MRYALTYMSSGSKTYGIERARAQAAVSVVTDVAVAEDVDDVRPRKRAERERQARRDAHPAVAERRGELVDGDTGVRSHGAAQARSRRLSDRPQRRGDDVDVMASRRQPLGQLPGDPHRAAECDGRPVDGRSKEDAQTAHAETLA